MEEIKLDVQVRKEIGARQIRSVRREDFIPAIVYGQNREPTAIKVDRRTYERIRRTHLGQSVVFHLNVLEDTKKLRDYSAIVKEEQLHPVHDRLLHVDFQRISLKEEIEVEVPLVLKGESVGVKKDGGAVDQPLHHLDIVCLPTNIPESIVIDISGLSIGDAIHVKDISLPSGVKTKHDPEGYIVSIVPPMREEEPEDGEEPEEPEVTKEKKPKAEDTSEES